MTKILHKLVRVFCRYSFRLWKIIVSALQEIEIEIENSVSTIFNKAKNAYIAEIKSEILSRTIILE